MTKKIKTLCVIQTTAAMAAWASLYPFLGILQGSMPPILMAFGRFFCAALVLTPIMAYLKKLRMPDKSDWFALTILSAMLAIPTALIVIGVKYSSTMSGSIIVNSNTLMIGLLAPLLIKEKNSRTKKIALTIGFIGVMTIVLQGFENISHLFASQAFFGSLILLGTAVIVALSTIYLKKYIKKYGGFFVSYITLATGSLLLLPITIIDGSIAHVAEMTSVEWVITAGIGVLSTAIPYVIWQRSIKHLGVTVAGSFKMLIPVFANMYAVIFLGEIFTLWTLIGIILTSTGVFFTQREEFIEQPRMS